MTSWIQEQVSVLGVHDMAEIYLSDTQVAARYGVHRTTPWRWEKTDETFPKPIRLTAGCTRWRLSQLEVWEKKRSAAE